jgi:hypothetical protein
MSADIGNKNDIEIKTIRVFGERNSGTNFLVQLCLKNFNCRTIQYDSMPVNGYINEWKHGEPIIDMYGDNKHILYLIIFRDLESWLKSFFHTQWHVKRTNNFEKFLTIKQSIGGYIEYDRHTKKKVNVYDVGKDIFEIRYGKYMMLSDFSKKVPNVVQVNLGFIQNNVEEFITTISNVFNIGIINKIKIDTIPVHTKVKKQIRNRNYNIIMTDKISQIISEKKNHELEKLMNVKITIKKNDIEVIKDQEKIIESLV